MSRAEFYRLVSGVLRNLMSRTRDQRTRAAYTEVAKELADEFSRHNTKFDALRFHRDAGSDY